MGFCFRIQSVEFGSKVRYFWLLENVDDREVQMLRLRSGDQTHSCYRISAKSLQAISTEQIKVRLHLQ